MQCVSRTLNYAYLYVIDYILLDTGCIPAVPHTYVPELTVVSQGWSWKSVSLAADWTEMTAFGAQYCPMALDIREIKNLKFKSLAEKKIYPQELSTCTCSSCSRWGIQ